jgi:hypothetical protein
VFELLSVYNVPLYGAVGDEVRNKVQLENAVVFMLVTVLLIVSSLNNEQESNAEALIVSILDGTVKLSKAVQL